MYKQVLRSLAEDATIFPLVAVLVFFAFFVLLTIYVIRMDKKEVEERADIPFHDEPVSPRLKHPEFSSNGKVK